MNFSASAGVPPALASALRRAAEVLPDLEYVAFQYVFAVLDPARVYRLATLRKHTRGRWAREDGSLPALQLALLAPAAVAWGVAYGVPLSSPAAYAWLVGSGWAAFGAGGAAAATAGWAAATRATRAGPRPPYAAPPGAPGGGGDVEWAYAWDVHVTAYAPLFLATWVAPLLLAPIIFVPGHPAAALGNALWAAGVAAYAHSTYLGYATLPAVREPNAVFAPAAVAVLALLVLTALGVSAPRLSLGLSIE